jgi:peptidyl-prolyl cis-trans isomerase D
LFALIKNSLFGKDQPFDSGAYAAFLRQIGMNSQAFENRVRSDALRQEYLGALRLVSMPSQRESAGAVLREETKFNFEYVEFDPTNFQKEVKDPDAAALEAYYQEHGSEYQLAPRVSYDFVAFDPEKFLDLVEVAPEDIELYYADHQSEFMTDEQVKVRHIQLTYAKSANPTEMAALKDKAEEVHQKALSGESFDALALQYSDDITSKGNGGELGWIGRGKMAKEFDAVAFKLKEGQISDVVQTDYGFHIIKGEGVKPSAPKDLSEVRAGIEKTIRKQEAPAYTSDKAHSFFEKWQSRTQPLAEFAAENNLAAASSNGLLEKEKDPDNGLRGLTAKVIAFPDEEKQTIDVGDKTVLVSIKQYKDEEIPPLEQVKTKVIENWKKAQAKKAAKAAADALVKSIADGKFENLKAAAQAAKLTLKEAKDLTISNRSKSPPFNDMAVEKDLFSSEVVGKKPSSVYDIGGTYLVAQTTAGVKPDQALVDSKVDEFRRRGTDAFLQTLALSITNRLKARAMIDVAPGLLTQES